MRTSTRILINAVTRWGATLINAGVGVVLIPILLEELGKRGYGLIGLASSIITLTMILDLGLRAAVSRQLAARIHADDLDAANRVASNAMMTYLGLGGLAAVVLATTAPWLVSLLDIEADLVSRAVWLVRGYAALSVLLTMTSVVYSSSLAARNRYDILSGVESGSGVIRAIIIYIAVVVTGKGLLGWAVASLAGQAIQLLLLRVMAHRLWPTLRIRIKGFDGHEARAMFTVGGYVFFLQLTSMITIHTDPIVLTRFLGVAAVALYTPALTITNLVRPLVQTLTQQLHPVATAYYVKDQKKQLQDVLIRGTSLTFLMGIGASVALMLFAEPLTRHMLYSKIGDEYRVTMHVLMFWTAIHLLKYSAGSQWPVLLGMKRLRFLVWTQFPLAFINLALSILLVGWTNLGVIGVVIPTLAIEVVRRPILFVYCARVVGISPGKYFMDAYFRPLIVLVLLSAGAGVIFWTLNPMSKTAMVVGAAILAVCWAVLTWFIGLSEQDKGYFQSIVRSRMAGRRANGRQETSGQLIN